MVSFAGFGSCICMSLLDFLFRLLFFLFGSRVFGVDFSGLAGSSFTLLDLVGPGLVWSGLV